MNGDARGSGLHVLLLLAQKCMVVKTWTNVAEEYSYGRLTATGNADVSCSLLVTCASDGFHSSVVFTG